MENTKPKKTRKIGKTILKIIGILLLIDIVMIVVLAIRHSIKCSDDRAFFEGAYGESYITPNGDSMNFTVFDSSAEDVLVMLPGYGEGSPRYEYDTLAKKLSDQYRVIVAEPLGYGLSDVTEQPRTVENYCSELHGLMQYLGFEKYAVLGHSMAGLYMTYYTNQYPDEVERFIGIDCTVPHQTDSDGWLNDPNNAAKFYGIMRVAAYQTGIQRLMTELSFRQIAAQIPTLNEDEQKHACAMFCTVPFNDAQMDEIRRYGENSQKCYDLKFPESLPVLYVLSQANCDSDPMWEQYHRDIVTNPESRVSIISGGHYLHWENLDGLLQEIANWNP